MAIIGDDPDGNTGGGGGGSGGGGGGGESWFIPDGHWLNDLSELRGVVPLLTEFARDPYGFIKTRIALLVVTGALTIVEVITGKIRALWGIVADAVESFGDSIAFGFGNAGTAVLDALAIVPDLLTTFASPSGPLGPAAPVIVGVGGALALYSTWHAIKRTPGALWKLYQAIPGT